MNLKLLVGAGLAGCLATAPVIAVDYSDAELTRCKTEGGCAVFTQREFEGYQQKAHQQGLRDCKLKSGAWT